MIKKILITLGAILGLLILGILIFLLTFDLNHYRPFVAELASKTLGRQVEIRSLSTKLSLIPTIKVEGVRILDPNQKEPILEIPKLEAVIDLPPLVHRQIFVQKITVPQATFVWRNSATAIKNKEPQNTTPAVTGSKKFSQIWIESFSINSLQCSIGNNNPYEFKINKLNLKSLSKFSFDIVYLKNTINVSGNFGSILDLLTKKESLPVDLSLHQNKSSVKINGKIEDLKNFKKMNFQVYGNIPNLSVLSKSWNIQSNKIPSAPLSLTTSFSGDLEKAELGLTTITLGKSDFTLTTKGKLDNLKNNLKATLNTEASLQKGDVADLWQIKPFEFSTQINATPTTVTLSNITLNAGKSDIKGLLRFILGDNPVSIQGKLDSVYFDVHDIFTQKRSKTPETQQQTASQKVFGTTQIPFELLKKFNADLQLNTTHLKFSDTFADYANINCSTHLKNGILNMNTKVKILDGTIDNQLKVNADQKGVSLKAQVKNVSLEKIRVLEKSIRGSLANADISLQTQGSNLHQLASGANGHILAELSSGEIINKDFNSLPATLNLLKGKGNSLSFSTQDQKTQLLCGAINVPITNGIISSNNQITLETDILNFIINGQINLRNETLSLSMIPSVSQTRGMANELLNISQSVQLNGRWTDIKSSVNPLKATEALVQLLGQKLSGEKKQNVKVESTTLCQKVLGRPLTKTKKGTPQTSTNTKASTTETTNKQQNLKQNFVQSLSQALTNQVTQKKQ